jgi:hypothetical protein
MFFQTMEANLPGFAGLFLFMYHFRTNFQRRNRVALASILMEPAARSRRREARTTPLIPKPWIASENGPWILFFSGLA